LIGTTSLDIGSGSCIDLLRLAFGRMERSGMREQKRAHRHRGDADKVRRDIERPITLAN
jgi:hypothetical protein